MSEKTDIEWQSLNVRIARKIMGWFKWDELPAEARKAYWAIMEEEPGDWTLGYCHEKWWFLDDSDCPDWEYSIEEWQPHNDLTQAIKARDRIASWGFDWCISRWAGAPQIQVLFMRGAEHYDGYADTDAKAVCLAIENFREANC